MDLESLIEAESVICHDDALVLRTQKNQPSSRGGIEYDFQNGWKNQERTRLLGWYNPRIEKFQSIENGPPDFQQLGWKETWERACWLPGKTRLVTYSNNIELRIGSLWKDFRRRYRLGLESVVDASYRGIVRYTGNDATKKHRQEALRNRLKKYWTVAAYEHDLVVSGEIAQTLMSELRSVDDAIHYENTVYLKGHGQSGKDAPTLVKAYDMSNHGLPNLAKIEVTFRGRWMKQERKMNGQTVRMRQPELWETQPKIQDTMKKALRTEWRRTMANAPRTVDMLSDSLGVPEPELLDAILENRKTLTEIMKRIEKLETQYQAQQRELQEYRERLMQVEDTVGITALDRKREW